MRTRIFSVNNKTFGNSRIFFSFGPHRLLAQIKLSAPIYWRIISEMNVFAAHHLMTKYSNSLIILLYWAETERRCFLKKTALCFWFFKFDLEYLRRVQSSDCFIQKWIQPPACWDHSLFRIYSSYWLSHCYLLKKSAKVLLYFGLNCGLLVFFKYSTHKP